MTTQLTIDGREVEVLETAPRRFGKILALSQRELLRTLGERGFLRTVEAGVIVHRNRGRCGFGAKSMHRTTRRRLNKIECCAYAHADGLEAMKRLARRGLVRRTFLRGRWVQA